MKTRASDERGAASVFVVLLTAAVLVGVGLVIDGGYALAARRELTTQAEQAARVGADAINEASLRDGGEPRVDPVRARAAAEAYLASVGAPPATITVHGDIVTVEIKSSQPTAILSIAGITSIPVSGNGAARSIDAETND